MSFNSPFTGNVIQPTDVSYRSITLSADTQLEWPINGSPTDNPAARIMNVTATAGNLKLEMPPANQASVGQDALIRNVGGTAFTVTDYNQNTIVSIAAGEAKYIYITSNATESGTWGVIAFGVGTSNPDASSLAGLGIKAISSTLNQKHPVVAFSATYTATSSDRASSYVWTGGAGTLNLPAPSSLGDDWFMMVRNAGTGSLSVTPASGNINDEAALNMQPSDSAIILCSGSAFYTVGLGKTSQFNFTQLTKAVTSGTYTLTSAEASNVIQKYTGTLSGNVTIELPPTIQVYYISNQTDGTLSNYDITFTTAALGGASAVVPAGEQVILLCDSVNLLNASTLAAGVFSLTLSLGSQSAPSLAFVGDLQTGIYSTGAGNFNVSIANTPALGLDSTGLTILGAGTFSSGVSGGTFT